MASTKITVNPNGSLKIEGDFEIVDNQGNVYGYRVGPRSAYVVVAIPKTNLFAMDLTEEIFEHEAVAFDLPPKKV